MDGDVFKLFKDMPPKQLIAVFKLVRRAEKEAEVGQSVVTTDWNAIVKAAGIEKPAINWNAGFGTETGRSRITIEVLAEMARLQEAFKREVRAKRVARIVSLVLVISLLVLGGLLIYR
jgi:hypothetical protein